MAPRRRKTKAQTKKRKHRNYMKTRHGTFENRLRSNIYAAKKRAKERNFEHDIEIADFEPQTHCKLLTFVSFKFDVTNRAPHPHSMSLDRIDPTKGYTKDNTWLICQRANRIKNDATYEEFKMIYLNWRAERRRRGLKV